MVVKYKYKIENVFITRKCSLKCWHCMIWKTHRKEIPPQEWIKILNTHYSTIVEFINIMGGEPLEYWKPFEGLLEVVKGIRNIEYSISSNSVLLTWDRAKKLVEAGLKNWSVSIDFPREVAKHDPRAIVGWRALEWFKKLGVEDLHVTITLYPINVKYFPILVKELMEMEVWIEPTFAMWAKAPWYESFPASIKPEWKAEHLEYIKEGIELLKNYKYFHGMLEMFTGEGLEQMLNATFKCGRLYIPVVDEDGHMRLCRDIAGNRVRRWHALDIVEHMEEFVEDWQKDYEELCRGCNWDCLWQAAHGFNNFAHRR